jgi:hypothetical protein
MNPVLKSLSPSATDMIRMDHTRVLAAFHRYALDAQPKTKQGLVNGLCVALEIHAQIEEEIFYPALRSLDPQVVEKSFPEHQEMRRLIALLRAMDPAGPEYDATFMELMRAVIHHVADEETTLLPDAERRLAGQLGELGARMSRRRVELGSPRAGELARNMAQAVPPKAIMVGAGALLAGAFAFRALGKR